MGEVYIFQIMNNESFFLNFCPCCVHCPCQCLCYMELKSYPLLLAPKLEFILINIQSICLTFCRSHSGIKRLAKEQMGLFSGIIMQFAFRYCQICIPSSELKQQVDQVLKSVYSISQWSLWGSLIILFL